MSIFSQQALPKLSCHKAGGGGDDVRVSSTCLPTRSVGESPNPSPRDLISQARLSVQRRCQNPWHLLVLFVTGKRPAMSIRFSPDLAQFCPTLQPYGLQPTRLLCSCDIPRKNTGAGYHFLYQGIFPTQGLNPASPALAGRFFPNSSPGKPHQVLYSSFSLLQYPWEQEFHIG